MALHNVLVKLLDGKTATLKFTTPTISGETLKAHLQDLTQIPQHNQRLLTGTQQIDSKTLITIPNDSFLTIHLLLRLVGGKGGFGSLLRGAATKAGQKKTNNFDACRDMSGRRLRHVNAEKKLEEWKAEAEERKLEKIAEDFIKKKAKAVKKSASGESEKYIKKYREDSEKCMEVVEAAVRDSMKRKVLPSVGSASKRLKLWNTKGKDEEIDSDDDEDEDEDEESDSDDDDKKSVVLDDVSTAMRREDGEGSSRSVSEGQASEGEFSGGVSAQSDLEEEKGVVNVEKFEVGENSVCGVIHDDANEMAEVKLVIHEEKVCETEVVHAEERVPESSLVVVERSESKDIVAEVNASIAVSATEITTDANPEKPLDFDDYNVATEMEVLGMERLKAELQARGLKCGGTLQERAARLFLLKTTPVEMLPKKLLAKK